MRFLSIAIAVLAALPVSAALADDDCQVPREAWKPLEVAMQAAADLGWRVESIKADDGCWEIQGVDAQGQRIKAKLDPASLQVVALRRGGGHDGHDGHDGHGERRGGGGTGLPAAAPAAPPGNPLFQTGVPPVVRVN